MPITATSTEPSTARAGLDRTALTAVVVCWLFVVFDGYDLIVYGNVLQPAEGLGYSVRRPPEPWAA